MGRAFAPNRISFRRTFGPEKSFLEVGLGHFTAFAHNKHLQCCRVVKSNGLRIPLGIYLVIGRFDVI